MIANNSHCFRLFILLLTFTRLMRKVASRMNKVFEEEIEEELGFKKDAEDETKLK